MLRLLRRFLVKLVLLAALVCLQALSVLAEHPLSLKGIKVAPDQLERQLATRMERVDLFRFLRASCQELRIRCWMVGGTASSFAHYVKWDLAREAGDGRFVASRFGYHLDQFIRSTQDLDFAVDGPPENVGKLQGRIEGYLGGSSIKVDVASLRHGGPEAPALLSAGFLDQHNDSHSLGAIEITPPPAGESVARDLRSDWDSAGRGRSTFIDDVANGRLRYYYSARHGSTPLAHRNPELLSVIRTYIKKFQFDLELSPEHTERLKEILRRTGSLPSQGYVANWLESNAPKLVRNAANMEEAVKELDELGLRQMLRQNPKLTYWMSWTPLPYQPVGTGEGRTAAALGLADRDILHNTPYEAFEAIRWSPTGKVTFLPTDKRLHGQGRYRGVYFGTAAGHNWGGVEYVSLIGRLKPHAREGVDFLVESDTVVVFNPDAFIPAPVDAANLGVVDYFKRLAETNPDDRPRLTQLALQRLRSIGQRQNLSPAELSAIAQVVENALARQSPMTKMLLGDAERIPKLRAALDEIYVRQFFQASGDWRAKVAGFIKDYSEPKVVAGIIDRSTSADQLAEWGFFFRDPKYAGMDTHYAKVLEAIGFSRNHMLLPIASNVFTRPHAATFPKALGVLIAEADPRALQAVKSEVLSAPQWRGPEFDYLRQAAATYDPDVRWVVVERGAAAAARADGARPYSASAVGFSGEAERAAEEGAEAAAKKERARRLSDAELNEWLKGWKEKHGRGPTLEEAKEALKFLYPGNQMPDASLELVVKVTGADDVLKNARGFVPDFNGCITDNVRRLLLLP